MNYDQFNFTPDLIILEGSCRFLLFVDFVALALKHTDYELEKLTFFME